MPALILVDIQYDFLPGGALAVPDGDAVIAVANRLIEHFPMVLATQDWHPADHLSFASQHDGRRVGESIELGGVPQTLWPVHCVQNTPGAAFSDKLQTSRIRNVFQKGTDREIDSYSGFFDNGQRRSTGMGGFLKDLGIGEVYIMGLATDYCVKFTALDAVALGLETHVIEDGCRGVDLIPSDSQDALAEMQAAGVHLVSSRDINLARLT
ncbi:MAG: bifunctional nicotinamidase/pyrazinamidase [Pirellulaceae bacterium]